MAFDFYQQLVQNKLISTEDLKVAMAIAQKEKIPLREVLIEKRFISEESLLSFLSKELNIPFEHIDIYTSDPITAKIVPELFARNNFLVPLFLLGDVLTVAFADPLNIEVIQELESLTRLKINRIISTKKDISNVIQHCYTGSIKQETEDKRSELTKVVKDGMDIIGDNESDDEEVDINRVGDEAPFAKIVDNLLKQAIQRKASDIHIEPMETMLQVRMRIDGILYKIVEHPKKIAGAIVSRIKVMSGMDITERRKPQDGRISFKLDGKEIDLRISTIRTIYGEKVVMRLLDKNTILVTLDKLGFPGHTRELFMQLIQQNSGIMLVTGPTGSGKTTTLYSALKELNTPDKNLLTIEDPVEYNLPNVNQIPVNPRAGVTFATGLRTILRQDPDIIMVGEIRDLETAQIAIQASQTGHFVFSTLHTNNAPATIVRLSDMGVPSYLIASSVVGILAQRLVRVICPRCIQPATLNAVESKKHEHLLDILVELNGGPINAFRGRGCKDCEQSGYKGRTGVYELMCIDEEIGALIHQNVRTDNLRSVARSKGMTLLIEDGLEKIKQGITTLDEVARVLL